MDRSISLVHKMHADIADDQGQFTGASSSHNSIFGDYDEPSQLAFAWGNRVGLRVGRLRRNKSLVYRKKPWYEGHMEPWVAEFIDVWQKNRVEIGSLMLEANESNLPVKGYRLEDILQVFDGLFAMMQEELLQTGSEIRDTYMNVVVPGLLAQGQPLIALVGQATMNGVLIDAFLAPKAQEQYRNQISRYIATFYMKLNMDMMKIAAEAGAAI